MSLSGLKDTDREILKHIDDKELLKICHLDRKTWNQVCDDNFLRRRLSKYPGIEKYKRPNESWKQFFLRVLYYIGKIKEEFKFSYTSGDFRKIYELMKNRNWNELLVEAAKEGDLRLVKYSLGRGTSLRSHNLATDVAQANRHQNVVNELNDFLAPTDGWSTLSDSYGTYVEPGGWDTPVQPPSGNLPAGGGWEGFY